MNTFEKQKIEEFRERFVKETGYPDVRLWKVEESSTEQINKFEQFLQTALREQREMIEKYVDEKVVEKHKTCLTDDFDNGQFWAYKDMQQKIISLTPQEELEIKNSKK